jgi:hypothetical protein
MQIKFVNLLVLTGITCITTANASSIATISALNSPVWLQQENSKTRLSPESELKIGDSIATGDAGQIEIQLWVNASLQLNSNSEITIRAEKESGQSVTDSSPELVIHRGRACIDYTAQSSSEHKFIVNIGNAMFVAIHLHGDICIFRGDGLSAIKLRAGSVQVTHTVDPNTMIFSEAGTELYIEDNGSYELLFPGGNDLSRLEIEKPFAVEAATEKDAPGESVDNVGSNNGAAEEFAAAESEVKKQDTVSAYIYTVYLFSARSEEVAEQANQRFRKAGHDAQIYASETDSGSRYRVAVTGFESDQAARNYADSVVGTLGISGTWIGKESR